MTRYSAKIKIYVLEQRNKRKKPKWKSLQESIKRQFDIEPPTIRMMQKWEKELDPNDLSAEFQKDMKKKMPAIAASAELNFAQSLLPTIMNAEAAGEDLEITGWKWFLQFMETQMGSDKFEKVIADYMKNR